MAGMAFGAVTRQSFGSALRQGSIFSLDMAGLMAAIASSSPAEARNRGGKKKKKHKNQNQQAPQECPPLAEDLCPREVQPCVDALTIACQGEPAQCAEAVACCSNFATCNVGEFFTCLIRVATA